jgi:hypothetical protein
MHGRDEERSKEVARSPVHHVGATSGARIGGTGQQGPFGHRAISRRRLIRLYDGLPVRFPLWLPPLPSSAAWYRHFATAFLTRLTCSRTGVQGSREKPLG